MEWFRHQKSKSIKKKYNDLIFVTPGIRLPNEKLNDQKRVDTPGRAIKNGSSILVIGRTINRSSNPVKSIQKIIKNIENELKKPKLKFVELIILNQQKLVKEQILLDLFFIKNL